MIFIRGYGPALNDHTSFWSKFLNKKNYNLNQTQNFQNMSSFGPFFLLLLVFSPFQAYSQNINPVPVMENATPLSGDPGDLQSCLDSGKSIQTCMMENPNMNIVPAGTDATNSACTNMGVMNFYVYFCIFLCCLMGISFY